MPQSLPPTPIGSGVSLVTGVGSFSGNATSCTIPCPLQRVLHISLTPFTTHSFDDDLRANATLVGNSLPVTPGGNVTIDRFGSALTGNLTFSYAILGT